MGIASGNSIQLAHFISFFSRKDAKEDVRKDAKRNLTASSGNSIWLAHLIYFFFTQRRKGKRTPRRKEKLAHLTTKTLRLCSFASLRETQNSIAAFTVTIQEFDPAKMTGLAATMLHRSTSAWLKKNQPTHSLHIAHCLLPIAHCLLSYLNKAFAIH